MKLLAPLLACLVCICLAGLPLPQGSGLLRATPVQFNQVPLAPNAGPANRDADHATVAMNSERDIVTNNLTVLDTNLYDSVSRPAAAYHFHSGATNPDYVVATWEKRSTALGPLTIWIGVE